MNADGLFRGPDTKKDPGIRQVDLMRAIGHGAIAFHIWIKFQLLQANSTR